MGERLRGHVPDDDTLTPGERRADGDDAGGVCQQFERLLARRDAAALLRVEVRAVLGVGVEVDDAEGGAPVGVVLLDDLDRHQDVRLRFQLVGDLQREPPGGFVGERGDPEGREFLRECFAANEGAGRGGGSFDDGFSLRELGHGLILLLGHCDFASASRRP